ncbi:syntaxin-6 [Phymastichus coffea]|uniref:syntaxin-6 n=1 Tax=Phymastichus coffea TaxID=108790 RepID=UPI00273B986E|nr:syntaxin-6 [Phymastichus coffea]
MTPDDPYFVIKEEVNTALAKARNLFQRWVQLNQNVASGVVNMPQYTLTGSVLPTMNSLEELQWTTNELKNALRSLEWDLEDLDDCINILFKNPNKFKVDSRDISMRRGFLTVTSAEVKVMRDKLNISRGRDCNRTACQPTSDNSRQETAASVSHGSSGSAKYSKLENETDSPNRRPICNQNEMMQEPNDRLDMANDNKLNFEFDARQVMLDDCGNEMEIITTSRLDATMKKMAKVLHMNNGNYDNYVPAANTEFAAPKPSYMSLCSIARAISNCFICNRN